MGLEETVECSRAKIDLLACSFDASEQRGRASAVVFPKNEREVVNVVRFARDTGKTLVPRGGGTGLAGGAVPKDAIVVDLSKMCNIEIKGSVATVGAGVILDELNKALEGHGLVFPVQPSSHAVATIGGMVSTNAEGNHAIRWGRVGDWVDKIEAVDGEGNVVSSMDFCGTEGTLGIITKVKLKLCRPPERSSLSVFRVESYSELEKKINELSGGVIALEFLDKKTSRLLGESGMVLLAEFEGEGGELSGKESCETWRLRDGAYPVLAAEGYPMIQDPKMPRENIVEFLRWLENEDIPVFGHVGIGTLHPCFKMGDSKKVRRMMEKVKEMGGAVTGEHGYGLSKKEFVPENFKKSIGELKLKYDPQNIINRGKIVG